ncbi:MAG: hypothetical protein R6V30_08845 [Paracoccaceae bacterium]
MASKPTHYKITVNRPFEFARARFRPGARYTVTAEVYDQMKADHGEAIKDADPIKKG